MKKSLFEFMPSKALITLVDANSIKEKSFANPDWYDAYQKFVKETNYKDIDAEKFLAYVKHYSRLQNETVDKVEVRRDGTGVTTLSRMIDPRPNRGIQDYREAMLGRYYGIR